VGQGSGKESSAIPASISLDIEMFGAVDKPGNYLDVKRDVVVMWDPQQYRRFGDERSRPFFDLVGRIDSGNPRSVADLGCGPGNLTATLAERWPEAAVTGVDSSPAMIEAARAGNPGGGRLSFVLGDIGDWTPDAPLDVIVSNAALQWLPDQLKTLSRWAGLLAPGGWLAVQAPGNFDQPGHAVMRELAASGRWRPLLDGVQLNRQATDPADYLDLLAGSGCVVDAWETTYLHVLPGEDPVLEWYKGTGLRPVLDALPPDLAGEFTAEYGARMRAAYPARPYGTVFPFRRVFVVARRVSPA
jgi:trans-aconitate 2-methyltransferase